eukprot:558794-Amphidinium_carterae.1
MARMIRRPYSQALRRPAGVVKYTRHRVHTVRRELVRPSITFSDISNGRPWERRLRSLKIIKKAPRCPDCLTNCTHDDATRTNGLTHYRCSKRSCRKRLGSVIDGHPIYFTKKTGGYCSSLYDQSIAL